jgi:hypothetical protein
MSHLDRAQRITHGQNECAGILHFLGALRTTRDVPFEEGYLIWRQGLPYERLNDFVRVRTRNPW